MSMMILALAMSSALASQVDSVAVARAFLTRAGLYDAALTLRVSEHPGPNHTQQVNLGEGPDLKIAVFVCPHSGVVASAQNLAAQRDNLSRKDLRSPTFIRSEDELESKLRSRLERFGIPQGWATDWAHLAFDGFNGSGRVESGSATILVSERVEGLPTLGLRNFAELVLDPADGAFLSMRMVRRAKPVPGPFAVAEDQARRIGLSDYSEQRHEIVHGLGAERALAEPGVKSVEKGYGVSETYLDLPPARRYNLPAYPAWKVDFEGPHRLYVIVSASDGQVIWRSWSVDRRRLAGAGGS